MPTADDDTDWTPDQLDEDEQIWEVSIDSMQFSTEMVLPVDETQMEAESIARERLVEAIQNGDADIQWRTIVTTKADLEYEEELTDLFRCERCNEPWEAGLNELDREQQGEFYDFGWASADDQYVLVCDPCKEEMWEAAHATDTEMDQA